MAMSLRFRLQRHRGALGGVGLLVALVAWAAATRAQTASQETPAASDPCAVTAGETATIESVTALGDIRLAGGRLARLADLDFGVDAVSAGSWLGHVASLREALDGLAVRIDEGGGFPDRWGRRALRISPAGDSPGASIHRRLVEKGLARVSPLGEHEVCAASLLPVEAAARAQGLGLWREPAARLVNAGEAAALRALTGRFVIVQGTVLSVGQRPRRTYLNFGRDFSRDFSVTLTPRTARLLEKAGISPSSLRGKIVRVRGMVGGRRAPAIEIAGAGQLEVVQ